MSNKEAVGVNDKNRNVGKQKFDLFWVGLCYNKIDISSLVLRSDNAIAWNGILIYFISFVSCWRIH